MTVTLGNDIHDITNGKDLPELHLTPSEIAAIKLSYLELISKVTVNELTGVEETGLDRVTRKAYKMDPQLTKMLFGIEATRRFDVDERTGLRKKVNEDSLRDDLSFIDASIASARANNNASQRSRTVPPSRSVAGKKAPEAQTPADSEKASPKKVAKRATSRPKRQGPGAIANLLKEPAQKPDPEALMPFMTAPADPPAPAAPVVTAQPAQAQAAQRASQRSRLRDVFERQISGVVSL